MRSNWVIIMVFSGLKNQSQCWKGLTVPSPYLNVQRKMKCGKPLSFCSPASGTQSSSLKSWSRNRQRIPVLPSQQSNWEGAEKGQNPGHSVLAHRAAGNDHKTLQHQHVAREPGAMRRVGMRAPSTQGTVDPVPRAVRGQVKPRNAWLLLLGQRKIVHIIFCRLQAKSCSFYLQKLFQVIDSSKTTHIGKGNKALAS